MSSLEALQNLKKIYSYKTDETYEMGKWNTWYWLRNQPDTRELLRPKKGRYDEKIESLRKIYYPTYTCCTYCKNYRSDGLAQVVPGQFEEYVYYIEKLKDLDNGK